MITVDSGYGLCVDVLASGDRVTRVYNTGDRSYIMISGTSQVAPLVSDVKARYISSFKDYSVSPSSLDRFIRDSSSSDSG